MNTLFPSSAIQPPQANPATGQNGAGLADQWREWLKKPQNSSMLLQSGIAMLQPMSLGQTTLGAIGSSIGSGMEAHDAVIQKQREREQLAMQNQQKQQELETQQMNAQTGADRVKAETPYWQNLGMGSLLRGQAANTRANNPPSGKNKDGFTYPQWLQKRLAEDSTNVGYNTSNGIPGSSEWAAQQEDKWRVLTGSSQTMQGGSGGTMTPPTMSNDAPMLRGPNGEIMIVKDGQWVPLNPAQ